MITQDTWKQWQSIDVHEMDNLYEVSREVAIRRLFFSSLLRALTDMPTVEVVYLDPRPLLSGLFVRLISDHDEYLAAATSTAPDEAMGTLNIPGVATTTPNRPLYSLCRQFYNALRPSQGAIGGYAKVQKSLTPYFADSVSGVVELSRAAAMLACEHCLITPGFTFSPENLAIVEAQALAHNTLDAKAPKSAHPRL